MPTPTLHAYQRVARDYLRTHDQAALFLDMGLGKTASTLSALEPDHLPALVTAPKRVAENVWETEQRIWRPDLSIAIAAGSPQQRTKALRSGADIVVIGRDNLRDVTPAIAKQFKTFIIDELSGFRTRSTVRWKAAWQIRKVVDRCWGLTGTPSPNGLMDLWAQIALLDNGERLGKTVSGFRDRYFTPGRQLYNGVITEWYLRPGADKRIMTLIEDICISMQAEDYLDLPPVTYNTVLVPLTPTVRKMYRDMAANLVLNLELLGGEVHTAANAAVLSNKLAQVTAGFLYSDEADIRWQYDPIHKEKIRALEEIVDGHGTGGVLVFYWYQAEMEQIAAAIPTARHIDSPGAIADWNAGKVPVMLAHPASAGHGLNLQHGGHTIVWTTGTWDLELWDQANARLARQGQKHPVVVHTLVSPRTVDVAMQERVILKTSVQDALKHHLDSVI